MNFLSGCLPTNMGISSRVIHDYLVRNTQITLNHLTGVPVGLITRNKTLAQSGTVRRPHAAS